MDNKSYSKGISWFDDCRIPFVETDNTNNWTSTRNKKPDKTGCFFRGASGGPEMNNKGRFPANILVSDDMLNDGNSGGSSYCSPTDYFYELKSDEVKIFGNGKGLSPKRTKTGIGDKGTNSRYYDIDKWFDKIIND